MMRCAMSERPGWRDMLRYVLMRGMADMSYGVGLHLRWG